MTELVNRVKVVCREVVDYHQQNAQPTSKFLTQSTDSLTRFTNHSCSFVNHYVDMWWLPLAGSLKFLVSFAKEPYKRDYILQKRPSLLRSLLIVATPKQSTTSRRTTSTAHTDLVTHTHTSKLTHIVRDSHT